MRVLLVEDNDDLRGAFARLLRMHGCDVRAASDGPDALALLAAFTPEFVVTDFMMPGMDGVEMIRRLLATPGLAAMRVVVVTADDAPATIARVRAASACEVFAKPLDFEKFVGRFLAQP